jgi:hypothetical protein
MFWNTTWTDTDQCGPMDWRIGGDGGAKMRPVAVTLELGMKCFFLDSAEKTPVFCDLAIRAKKLENTLRLYCHISDLFGAAGVFWWCFLLFIFDHLRFFSRISFYTVSASAKASSRQGGRKM